MPGSQRRGISRCGSAPVPRLSLVFSLGQPPPLTALAALLSKKQPVHFSPEAHLGIISGMEEAWRQGKKTGRPPGATKEQAAFLKKLCGSGPAATLPVMEDGAPVVVS
ncbi:hypothetical protein GCM10022406_40580 [Hymenobacter algoricola]|uniref:Uncharacterized protein n=1 Tax=Hymenobacter algoricola TaxID=486267 RepID=A0ABP7NY35_9BACT